MAQQRAATSALATGAAVRSIMDEVAPLGPSNAVSRKNEGVPGMGPPPDAVHEPGGDLLRALKHDHFTTRKQTWTVKPVRGIFHATPSKPVTFDLGAFVVPKYHQFWIFDYGVRVLLQSSLNPGDYEYAEEGRFRGVLGVDMTISGDRPDSLRYQLEPVTATTFRQQFESRTPTSSSCQSPNCHQFTRAQEESVIATSGAGLALSPVGQRIDRGHDGPYTVIARGANYVNLAACVFRAFRIPIAAFEGRISGFLINENVGDALIGRMAPR